MAIRVLSPQLAARIAAGEVVERPASVVKELVENSLDAGADTILVEINGGGLKLIRVVDNGIGIPAGEAALAFQRFATSKISHDDNLESITTLGFRGEALPSIAAVSNVRLITRPAHESVGTLVDVSAGQIIRTAPHGSPAGSSVAVSGLFQNVPARIKFLRSSSAESSRVQTIMQQFALAFPHVRFQLAIDGRTSFTSSGGGDLRDACSAIYGSKTARSLLEVMSSDVAYTTFGPIGIYALVSPPEISRANRSYINFLVNRRWIQSRTLTYALEGAFHGFLMERRHPIAVVHITVPTQDVDVNVHPAKLEVRFRQERDVFTVMQRAIRGTLVGLSPVPNIRASLVPFTPPIAPLAMSFQGIQAQTSAPLFAAEEGNQSSSTLRGVVPSLRVIGQVQNLYIVAEGSDGMYLIDQHAAHERVIYERVQEALMERQPLAQGLLEVVVVEVPMDLDESVESHLEEWARYGFDLEVFGTHSYLLRAIPVSLKDYDPREVFLSILEDTSQPFYHVNWEERMASSIACHSAVRAGKTLTQEEMAYLLAQLWACDQPTNCPHGRPTTLHLSGARMQQEFGRR